MATEVDRLVVVFDANFKRMEDKLEKVIQKNEKTKRKLEQTWTGKGLTAGLEKGFDDLAKSVGGAASALPGLGSAFGVLGAAGLVAAAGVGAFALAMKETEAAINYAADIKQIAVAVGVSTDFIQEFNYAAEQSDIAVGVADDALKGLNATLGAITLNLPKSEKAAKIFSEALGISREQLKSYSDVSELLPVIAEKIKQAGTYAEKYAIAKKFGIEALLPMLIQGAEGFNALAQAAHELGIVLDASVINKGAAAEDSLRKLDAVMKAQKAATFIEYKDALIEIKQAFVDAQIAGLQFLAFLTKTTPVTREIVRQQAAIAAIEQGKGDFLERWAGKSKDDQLTEARLKLAQLQRQANLEAYHARVEAEASMRAAGLDTGGTKALPGKDKPDGTKSKPVSVTLTKAPDQVAFDPFTMKTLEEQRQDALEAQLMPQPGKEVEFDAGRITPLDNEWFTDPAGKAADLKEKLEKATHEAIFDGVKGGLMAAADGDFLEYLQAKVKNALFNAAADGLTSWITKAGEGEGGNPFAEAFGNIIKSFEGYAGGTSSAPGGVAWVGEHGKELVNLPRGSQVIPNSALRNAGISGQSGGSPVIVFDNRGAVIWEQAARQLMAYADRAALQSGATAFGAARRATPQDMFRSGARRLN